MPGRPTARYEYRIRFRAPLSFVYRWCTDYTANDPRLEGEEYQRRVISRTARRVVYEDLSSGDDGWMWARHTVTLDPPAHWHSESIGNRRHYRLDYRLRRLPDGSTELRFVGRRRPAGLGSPNPAAKAFARTMDSAWRRFRRALERDYRRETPAR